MPCNARSHTHTRTHKFGKHIATAMAAIHKMGNATMDLYKPRRRMTKEVPVREKRKEMPLVICGFVCVCVGERCRRRRAFD